MTQSVSLYSCDESEYKYLFKNTTIPAELIFVENESSSAHNNNSKLIIYYCSGYDEYHQNKIIMLKKRFPYIPIIITISRRSTAFAVWALRKNIFDLVFMPEESEYLLHRVNEVMANYENINRKVISKQNKGTNNKTPCYKPISDDYPQNSNKISRALRYIDTYYRRKITNDELAKLCNMSTQSFTRSFKHEIGMTVCKYLKKKRISVAARLLKDHTLSIQQIAYKTGFDDASYFNRIFKSIECVTPSTYRAGHSQ